MCEFSGRRVYTGRRLDYRLMLWAPISASRAVSTVAELHLICEINFHFHFVNQFHLFYAYLNPSFCSPLSPSITLSLFHSKLKTYLFGKSFPPKISLPQNLGLTSSANGTVFCFYCLYRCSHVFGVVDKSSSSFSAHGKIGNFIIIKSN